MILEVCTSEDSGKHTITAPISSNIIERDWFQRGGFLIWEDIVGSCTDLHIFETDSLTQEGFTDSLLQEGIPQYIISEHNSLIIYWGTPYSCASFTGSSVLRYWQCCTLLYIGYGRSVGEWRYSLHRLPRKIFKIKSIWIHVELSQKMRGSSLPANTNDSVDWLYERNWPIKGMVIPELVPTWIQFCIQYGQTI